MIKRVGRVYSTNRTLIMLVALKMIKRAVMEKKLGWMENYIRVLLKKIKHMERVRKGG